MGFRSTLVTEHFGGDLPKWFHDKYANNYVIVNTLVSSKCELKLSEDFLLDYQKALNDIGWFNPFPRSVSVAILGEDGHVTKALVGKEAIQYFWLDEDTCEAHGIWSQ